MNRCLRISLRANMPQGYVEVFIQKKAKLLGIEGTVQAVNDDHATIVACGTEETIEQFLDELHKGDNKVEVKEISIEPFLKTKDYRGVFRVIE
jgi:acylphosphatase